MWQIRHQCPQCGGPITLDEADRLFACDFCKVRLYIFAEDAFFYYIPWNDHLPDGLRLVPYWRYRGIEFSCTRTKLTHTIVDRTRRAVDCGPLPYSLGVRPQALTLRFLTREQKQYAVPPAIPADEPWNPGERVPLPVEAERLLRIEGLPASDPILFRSFVGETRSLVFAPVCLLGPTIYDVLDQERLGELSDPGLLHPGLEQEPTLHFLSTLCPECGRDLEGERESALLICLTCAKAWSPAPSGLVPVPVEFLGGSPGRGGLYLPFWRVKARITGYPRVRLADARTFSYLGGAGRDPHAPDTFFWLPAFRIHPDLFLRVAQRMTIFPPEENCELASASPAYPVTLDAASAAASLKPVLMQVLAGPPEAMSAMEHVDLSVERASLVYVPFQTRGSELLRPAARLSLQTNALRYGKNL